MAAEEALLQIKRLTSKLKLKRDLIVKFLSYLIPPSKWQQLHRLACLHHYCYCLPSGEDYSLQRDGDSFTGTFLRKVEGHERTLLVIQTTNSSILGAYSNSKWENQGGSVGASFYGSALSCLFSFDTDQDTDETLIFKWTGKNRYIQVCNVHAKVLAFGGGGKDGEYWLCVEDDFRRGSTGPCETFGLQGRSV